METRRGSRARLIADGFDGTAARQLDLLAEADEPARVAPRAVRPPRSLRLLQKDVYAELARRRRRAQMKARRLLDQS
jgi:hypothetical protein